MTHENFDPRIRPIVLRKDLLEIADLIDLCFSENMDAEGRDYLRHIRQIARGLGGFLVEGTTPENSQLPFHGYLWEENGRIIGNLTLIQVRKVDRYTYLIANVAVHPDWRGRGIGTQLTERAIAHVREHGGRKIHLQVRSDNPTAIHIYRELGFEETARRTTWVWNPEMKSMPERSGEILVAKRRKDEWSEQKEWLRRIYPWSLTWNLPFNMERIKPGFWHFLEVLLEGGYLKGWSAYQGGKDIGTAVWESGASGSDYVWIGSVPEREDEAIHALLPVVLHNINQPQRISINYPEGQAREAFIRSGMKEELTLIWMAENISPENN